MSDHVGHSLPIYPFADLPLPTDHLARLLESASAGDADAVAQLVPLMYDELRRIAARYMRRERAGHSLQATALVHEAFIRLLGDRNLAWQNRAHFAAIAATSMRQILVERARARGTAKRGGGRARVTLEEDLLGRSDRGIDLLALDEALERLAALDSQHARIVELRFFGGLTIEETAETLGISPATVKRAWTMARAWLHRELAAS